MSSDDTDPAHWVFPPRGASNVPTEVSGSFGPVRYSDTMILQWAPATQRMLPGFCYIPPNGTASCVLLDEPVLSPYMWRFSETPPYDSTICHMYFHNTTEGNTVTWEYLTEAAANPTTWAALPTSTPSPPSTSSVTTMNSSTTTPQASAVPTLAGSASSPTSTPPPGPAYSKLFSASIGILTAVGIIVVALCVWLWLRRRRSAQRMEGSAERSLGATTGHQIPVAELSIPISELPARSRKPLEVA